MRAHIQQRFHATSFRPKCLANATTIALLVMLSDRQTDTVPCDCFLPVICYAFVTAGGHMCHGFCCDLSMRRCNLIILTYLLLRGALTPKGHRSINLSAAPFMQIAYLEATCRDGSINIEHFISCCSHLSVYVHVLVCVK